MTYWGVNAFFLAAVAIVGVVALVVARRRSALESRPSAVEPEPSAYESHREPSESRRESSAPPWLAPAISTGILLVMTAVFDNVMIGIGLVGYDRAKISGVFVGIAPLEDFAYAVAALVLLPSLWVLAGRTGGARAAGRSDR
jgi:lycopene cyclase domain-containing protein